MDPKIAAKLYCRYVTNNVPFFFLQPLKMEEAYLNPRIEVYHGVLEDDEIETVKKLATPRVHFGFKTINSSGFAVFINFYLQFKRATVQNHKTGELEPANYRISKSAWLKAEEHDHIFKVFQIRMC